MKRKTSYFLAKRMMVAEGVRLPVSRHFHYSAFGVRGRYESASVTGLYICPGPPGTGFFAHSSDSHSYRRFVQSQRKRMEQNIFTLLLGKEPSFDKENKLVEAAYNGNLSEEEKRILSSYQNVIALAKDEELLQRIVRAIKDRMHGRHSKELISILAHYKSTIATLEHDVKATQINFARNMSPEQIDMWKKVVDAFMNIAESRRIWSVYMEDSMQMYEQVYFDLGIFDYIQSPGDTPVMRDHRGVHYYIYPIGIIEAHSTVDFKLYKWSDIEMQFAAVDISSLAVRPQFHKRNRKRTHHDALTTLYGTTRAQVVGELSVPQLNLRFFVNHRSPVKAFVDAMHEYLKIEKAPHIQV